MNLLRTVALTLVGVCIGASPVTDAPPVSFTPAAPAPAPVDSSRPAATAPAGGAAGAGTNEMPQCPVGIIAIFPRDMKTVDGHDYAAILYSPLSPGVSTGTFWVNASGNAYHVPFTERNVLSKTLSGDIDVVNFRLPVDAHVENAFVDDLAGGETGATGGGRLLDA